MNHEAPDASEIAKRVAGTAAAQLVERGMCVGLGTGSTATHFVKALGERVRNGLAIRAVATSIAIERLAHAEGIATCSLERDTRIDLAVDGADGVTPSMDALKGFGGALFREKVVALAATRFVLVVDESKCVETVFDVEKLPIEVVPFGVECTLRAIERLGLDPALRRTPRGSPFVTDNGEYLVDATFRASFEPPRLAAALKAITGVIEHGLFLGLAHGVLVGRSDGGITTYGTP